MVTIRRLYLYIVCFISLQAAANALVTLLSGGFSWAVGADRPNAFFFTLQLAVLIVAGPIFLGHWLWALALARRDPTERGAFLYHLYLLAHQGSALALASVAAGALVSTLARFVFFRAEVGAGEVAQSFGALLAAWAVLGPVWAYHQWLATRPGLPQSGATRGLFHLYSLLWSGVGLALAAVGFFLVQAALIDWLAGNAARQGPSGLGLLAVGLPLWAFHEWQRHARRARLPSPVGDGLRWVYASVAAAAGVLLILLGLSDVLTRLAERLFLGALDHPPVAFGLLTTGLGLWAYHEWAVRRVALPAARPFRWLFAVAFSVVGLGAATAGGLAALVWLFSGLRAGAQTYAGSAALLLPGLLVWAYHQWLWGQAARALEMDAAEPGGFRETGRFLRRLYLYGFSGLGVALTTAGLIGVQDALFSGLRGRVALREALAWLLVGVPLWLYHWLWVGRLFARGQADERRSDLRKVYLYVIIFAAVNAAIITAGLTLNGLLRRLLGLPTEGQLAFSVAVIIAALALWVYHGLVLRGDIARAAESSLQGGLQRLYWYLVAAFGLGAFLYGLAGVLSDAISFLAAGLRANAALRSTFAANLAALLAGLPVWALAWWPAQAATRAAGPGAAAARRSWLRRLYLYGFALVAVIVTLVSAITVVYQLLNAVLRLGEGGNVLANMARAAGLAVIATAVWLYHVWVLRQDGKSASADRALEREQQAARAARQQARAAAAAGARWAGLPVAIVDDGDGRFARLALAALRRDLPALTLLPVGLTPAASTALAGEMPEDAPTAVEALPSVRSVFAAAEPVAPPALSRARLIIAPWTAAAREPVASSPLPKVIVPLPGTGLFWAGVNAELAAALPSDPGPQLARTVEAALHRLPAAAPSAVATLQPPSEPPAPPSEAPPIAPPTPGSDSPTEPLALPPLDTPLDTPPEASSAGLTDSPIPVTN
ncbi:MAG: hypothetical protein IT317_13355 [Anaerolineales bacterium]|nr:hypothetical protein [Anaerolineales bacterium]